MTAEPCAQRSKLHIIAVEEAQIFVVPFWNGEHYALKIEADFVLEQFNRKTAVIYIPAHTVVQVFGVLFVFEKADRMVHQPQAEPYREYPYAEVCDGGLNLAAIACFAVVPLVEHQRARKNRHSEVELSAESRIRGFVVAENIERDSDVD